MTIDTYYERKTGFVVHRATSICTLADILSAVITTTRPPLFTPTMFTLWDFSAASLDMMDLKKIREVSALLENVAHRCTGGAVAVVLHNRLEYNLARTVMRFAGNVPYDVQIFNDLRKASSWLIGKRQDWLENQSSNAADEKVAGGNRVSPEFLARSRQVR